MKGDFMEDIYISRKKQSSEPFEVHLFDEPPVPPQIPEEPPKNKKKKNRASVGLISMVR